MDTGPLNLPAPGFLMYEAAATLVARNIRTRAEGGDAPGGS